MTSSWQTLVVALWGVVMVQFALLLVLYRQVGIAYLGQNSARSKDGLPLHSAAPEWTGLDQYGAQLSSASTIGRPTLLVFAEPNCGPCQKLMPELQSFYEEWSSRIGVIVIASHEPEQNHQMADRYLLTMPVITQREQHIANSFRIVATPFLYFIDAEGRIRDKAILNFRSQIEQRIEAMMPQIVATEVYS